MYKTFMIHRRGSAKEFVLYSAVTEKGKFVGSSSSSPHYAKHSTSFTEPGMMVKIVSHNLKHHEDLVEGECQRRCLLV